MAWDIKRQPDGAWGWSCYQSAYGAATGEASTHAAAKVELAIAEARLFEHPFPPAVEDAMRADPQLFTADYPDTLS